MASFRKKRFIAAEKRKKHATCHAGRNRRTGSRSKPEKSVTEFANGRRETGHAMRLSTKIRDFCTIAHKNAQKIEPLRHEENVTIGAACAKNSGFLHNYAQNAQSTIWEESETPASLSWDSPHQHIWKPGAARTSSVQKLVIFAQRCTRMHKDPPKTRPRLTPQDAPVWDHAAPVRFFNCFLSAFICGRQIPSNRRHRAPRTLSRLAKPQGAIVGPIWSAHGTSPAGMGWCRGNRGWSHGHRVNARSRGPPVHRRSAGIRELT